MKGILGIIILISMVNGENQLENIMEPINKTSGLYFEFVSNVKFYKKNDEIKIISFFDMERYLNDVKKISELTEQVSQSFRYNYENFYFVNFLLKTMIRLGIDHNTYGDEFIENLHEDKKHLSLYNTAKFEELSSRSLKEYAKEIQQIRNNKINAELKHPPGVFFNDNFQYFFKENSNEFDDIKEALNNALMSPERFIKPAIIMDDDFESESKESESSTFEIIDDKIRSILSQWNETQHQIRNILTTPYYDFINASRMEYITSILKKDIPIDLSIAEGKRHLSIGISEPYIIFETRIPLVSKENYKLYKVYPLPIPQHDGYLFIQPNIEYLAIDDNQKYWTDLDELYFQLCLKSMNSIFTNHVCQFESERHKIVASKHTKCEIDLLIGSTYDTSDCKLTKLKFRSYWTQLNDSNSWLFSTNKNISALLVCQTSSSNFTIADRGILKIKEGCYIKSTEVKIVSKDFRNNGPIFMANNASIFHYKDLKDYDHLKHAIAFHQKNEMLHRNLDSNIEGHHSDKKFIYFLMFTLFILIIGVGIYLIKMGFNLQRFRLGS